MERFRYALAPLAAVHFADLWHCSAQFLQCLNIRFESIPSLLKCGFRCFTIRYASRIVGELYEIAAAFLFCEGSDFKTR